MNSKEKLAELTIVVSNAIEMVEAIRVAAKGTKFENKLAALHAYLGRGLTLVQPGGMDS